MINQNSKNISYSLCELSSYIGGKIIGDENIKINNIASLIDAREGDITFLSNPKYEHLVNKTKASALIASHSYPDFLGSILCTENPYLAYAKIIELFYPQNHTCEGISDDVSFGENVQIQDNVTIKSKVVLGNNVLIGQNTFIHPGVKIGDNCKIGDDCILYPNVVIYSNVIIGKGVIIHAGTIIGGDGFGYAQDGDKSYKIPQVGGVIIEDNVEIGCNTTIDRGALGNTIIGEGTKIDNLVQIAHNVVLGNNCIIVAQAAIAGSTKMGNGVALGGQSAVAGHIKVGDYVKLAAKSGLTKDTPSNTTWGGMIGKPINEWRKREIATRNLPKIQKDFQTIKKRLELLEKKINEK